MSIMYFGDHRVTRRSNSCCIFHLRGIGRILLVSTISVVSIAFSACIAHAAVIGISQDLHALAIVRQNADINDSSFEVGSATLSADASGIDPETSQPITSSSDVTASYTFGELPNEIEGVSFGGNLHVTGPVHGIGASSSRAVLRFEIAGSPATMEIAEFTVTYSEPNLNQIEYSGTGYYEISNDFGAPYIQGGATGQWELPPTPPGRYYTLTARGDLSGVQELAITGEWNFEATFSTEPPAPTEFLWNNPAGGLFSDASNWNPMQVPGASSTARVELAGEYAITLTENVENKRTILGGATNVARPNLVLNGRRLKTEQLLIEPNGRANIDGTGPGSVIEANLVNLADQASLDGDVWFKPTGGGLTLYQESQSSLRLGQRGDDSPERTLFHRTDNGPEPVEFYAHMVVRGDFSQEAASSVTFKLTESKAVQQSHFHENGAPLPATDLYVTGNADLQGTLNVVFEPGYEPEHGDSFSLIRGQVTSQFSSTNMPTVPHNGLKMVPVQTPHGVHAVVPQKVVLAFGHDMPVSFEPLTVFGFELFEENPLGSEDAFIPAPADAAAYESFKSTLLARVQKHYADSGIEGVVFEMGDPEDDAINIYFIDPSSAPYPSFLGRAYTDIDRLNRDAEGGAAVSAKSFDPANPTAVETDAETIIHEVGHLLGLRHIDPPGALPIMDYNDVRGDFELFTNGVFNIWEAPGDPGGTIYAETHNPMYHLRRYVDGVPHEDLVAMGILPGSWDLPGPVFEDLDAAFSFRLADGTDMTLFDVLVYKTEGDPTEGIDVLAKFDEITVAELAAESFRINAGEGLGLFASSLVGGEFDISLAPGNPFQSSSLVLYPGQGALAGFLQMEADNPAGFVTLADISIAVSIVPEPGTALLVALCAASLISPRRALRGIDHSSP